VLVITGIVNVGRFGNARIWPSVTSPRPPGLLRLFTIGGAGLRAIISGTAPRGSIVDRGIISSSASSTAPSSTVPAPLGFFG